MKYRPISKRRSTITRMQNEKKKQEEELQFQLAR